jgi:hypothetical protein
MAAMTMVNPIPITVVVSPVNESVGSKRARATPPRTVMNNPIRPARY